ncbi:hypothetical protein [Billgrantia kenyensis]|uniref:Uncharacterized protein n=1 Tax=Billgrantia kenyensis TaxID=321266 RepID=A0A7V9W578_9GAMM|nr:hypothetical protein [Halomonas kenyensis]MBA2781252.1 hypothetical protein [Halomonas kenyensis]MCG6663928.1 hypothetical protein [Halomonas kenyensis]
MQVVNIEEYNKEVVLHFGGERKKINAYTLASTLVSIADAVKDANSVINPGYDVEVLVEAFGEGSFRAKIKTTYKSAANIFSKDNLKAIALGVLASFIYEHTLAPDSNVTINVNSDEVIIKQGDKTIIVPRSTYEATKEVQKSEKFKKSVSRISSGIERDQNITSFGFTNNLADEQPKIEISRKEMLLLSNPNDIAEPTREIEEAATLFIKRAILERSKRKWEFVWRGFKISAPVLDEKFYDDFFAHKITIAPGDQLEAKLKIYQSKDEDTGIYSNDRYEVVEVAKHLPHVTQTEAKV